MPTIVHFEIPSDNVDRSNKFYSDLFGGSANTAYSKIAEWLDKCGRKKRLDYNPKFKSAYAL